MTSLEEELQRKKEEREIEKQMELKRHKELEEENQLERDARVSLPAVAVAICNYVCCCSRVRLLLLLCAGEFVVFDG